MKDDINTILEYLECEGEMFLVRNQILSLRKSRPAELQGNIDSLIDAINHTNIQSHKHTGFYYLFLGCAYFEQDDYLKAVINLQNAIIEMWGTQINKALAHWLLGLCYSSMHEFPKARNELQIALQLLAIHKGINSQHSEREHKSRLTIQQKVQDAQARLFNTPLFRDVRPDPTQRADRFPVQDPPTAENDPISISLDMPISVTNENQPVINIPVTVTNENYPVNKLNFNPPSPDVKGKTAKEEFENTEKDYETRTDHVGHLVIRSVPMYESYVRAGTSGTPKPVKSTDRFAEYDQVNIDGVLHTIHSLRSKSKRIFVTRESDWGWIKVKGKSMNEIKGNIPINNGDYVLFQINPNADDNDIVIAAGRVDHAVHVKRFRKRENFLYSETTEKNSAEYEPIDMELKNMEIIGIVYAVAKPAIS